MSGPVAAGALFPDASPARLDGPPRPLSGAWATGPALLVFAHGDCATSRLLLPFAARLHARGGPASQVLAVLQESVETGRALLAELGADLPVAIDADPYPVSEAVGLSSVPTCFVVEAGGRVGDVCEGFDVDWLESVATRLGVGAPLVEPGDEAPRWRPG